MNAIPASSQADLQQLGFVCTRAPKPLNEIVHSYWQISGRLRCEQREYLHPDGKLGLVFNWGDQQALSHGILYGPGANLDPVHTHSVALSLRNQLACFGVLLEPGVAHRLFDVPAHQLSSLQDLNNSLQSQLQGLTYPLSEAPDFLSRVTLVEQWLSLRLAQRDSPRQASHHAIQILQQNPVHTGVEQLCVQVNLSRRQLERLLQRDLGLSYKQFQNLLRVRCARGAIKKQSTRSLSDIALACGFYDQAHFNRVFSASMGITPGHYRQLTKTVASQS